MIDLITGLQETKRLTLGHLQKSIIWTQLAEYLKLGISEPRQLLFHCSTQLLTIPVCFCGNQLNWHSDKRTYRSFCSTKCTAIGTADKAKQTNIARYGKHFTQTPEYKEKVKQTSIDKYGVEHYSKSADFTDRVKATNIDRFGVEYPSQSAVIQQKIADTCLSRYNASTPMRTQSVKDKLAATNMQRYGTVHAMLNEEVRNKIQETNIARYGVANPMQNIDVSSKAGKTRKENYYSEDVLAKLSDPVWLSEQNQLVSIGELAVQLGVSASNLCKYFHQHDIPIKQHSTTELERKLLDYFTSKHIKVELKNRTLIRPKEIDLYFPDLKLGIEINGLYWHSEEFQPNKTYHLNKSLAAAEAGIELWHFWDYELVNHWDIIISKIEHKAGLSKRLYARKLDIRLVGNLDKSIFLQKNHIQQDCASSMNLGLYQKDHLVMVATFGKSRFDKKAKWELLRLAAEQNYSIVGGASKLLSNFMQVHMNAGDQLISYCHRRFSTGNVYTKLNFNLLHSTGPGYFYSRRGLPAGSRNQWQKHKLKGLLPLFDETLTESANMQANGYWRVWDCGQLVFNFIKG